MDLKERHGQRAEVLVSTEPVTLRLQQMRHRIAAADRHVEMHENAGFEWVGRPDDRRTVERLTCSHRQLRSSLASPVLPGQVESVNLGSND